MDDYITPLNFTFSLLLDNEVLDTKIKQAMGYKILLYLTSCFEGYIYPTDTEIPQHRIESVHGEIFNFLLIRHVDKCEAEYPYVMALLNHDTTEFIKVLTNYFDTTSDKLILTIVLDIFLYLVIDSKVNMNAMIKSSLYAFITNYLTKGQVEVPQNIIV